MTLHPLAVLLALATAGCAAVPPPPPGPPLEPPPLIRPPHEEAYNSVVANPDAARLLASLRDRDLRLVPGDVSRVDLLAGSPGYAWRHGQEHLHLHVYRGRQRASAAVARFVEAHDDRRNIIDWAGKPHLFQCGTAIALYLGTNRQALTSLAGQCGAPVRLLP